MYPPQSRWAADRQGSRAFGEDGRAREERHGRRPQTGWLSGVGQAGGWRKLGSSNLRLLLDGCHQRPTAAVGARGVPGQAST
jgi:hypothetical protein